MVCNSYTPAAAILPDMKDAHALTPNRNRRTTQFTKSGKKVQDVGDPRENHDIGSDDGD